MQRLLALVLVAIFGFPTIAPAFAQAPNNLPACCRRDGKHHCMGDMAPATSAAHATHAISARCAAYPQNATAAVQPISKALAPTSQRPPAFLTALTPTPHADTQPHLIQQRTQDNRGPPATFLA